MKAKNKVAIRFYGRLIGGYAFLFLSILSFGWLCNKFIESIFIILGYFLTRFVVPKIKHFDTTQKCISISTMTFCFAIAIICLPKNTTLVWSVLVGATIPLIMYAESLLFDVKISEKDKLIELCRQHGYNQLKTTIAIKFFYENEKPRDVWLWLLETKQSNIEWDSVNKMKKRMKKELFN